MEATSGLGSQSVDSFWGVKLSNSNKVHQFDELDEEDVETVYELRQACLGADAKEGRNVVQITAESEDGEEVTHTLFSMRVGGTEMAPVFLTVRPPAKLELVKGSGPVHITGMSVSTLLNISSDEDEDDEEEEVPALNKVHVKKGTKRPALSPASQPSVKAAKMIEMEAEEDSEEEEEEEEDGEEEEEELKKKIQKSPFLKKKLKAVDEDDDEEDEDEEDDEEDYSLDEDDEEEEEEEEMDILVPKKTKKKQLRSTPSLTTQAKPQFKTPQPQKAPQKSILKSPMSAPKPKKGSETKKNGNKPSGPPTLDELKKKLAASPNLPKKLDKFNNYMANTFKVSDPAVKKQMWEFVQKTKK